MTVLAPITDATNRRARAHRWLALLALAALSCGGPSSPSEPPIRDVLWRARSIQRADLVVAVPDPDRYTVRFGDGVGIRADCNTCGGSYTLSGMRIDVQAVFCTLIFCGEGSLDRDYLRLLDAADTAEVVDGELVLTSREGVLRFRP